MRYLHFFSDHSVDKNIITPYQRVELLFAKSEILKWTITKIEEAVIQAHQSFKFSPARDKNGCYSQPRLRWIRFVIMKKIFVDDRKY